MLEGRRSDHLGARFGRQQKFFNYSMGAPGVNFFANDAQITALRSDSGATTKSGTTYGNAAAGGLYSAVPAGQVSLSGRIGTVADAGVAIATVASPLVDGKYYSLYLSGPYNTTTKSTDAFLIEDAMPEFDYAKANVRFVNAIPNAPSPMVLWAKSTSVGDSVAIGGPAGIAYKGATAFVPIRGDEYDLTARYPGSNTAVMTLAKQSLAGRFVYTISSRGDITVTSTTAANRPLLSLAFNK